MINNYMCINCTHALVCKKIDTLVKFDSEDKKYIKVDITMESCSDFENANVENGEDE